MHANEREPQGTNVSLQTYMHTDRQTERQPEKRENRREKAKVQREIKRNEEESMQEGRGERGKDGKGRAEGGLLQKEKKTVRKRFFSHKIRAGGARQACSLHNRSHLRMLLQAWLLLWVMLLGLQKHHGGFLFKP